MHIMFFPYNHEFNSKIKIVVMLFLDSVVNLWINYS